MATNFEKWKDSLKPENFVYPNIMAGAICLICKDNCPVKNCPVIKSHERLTRIEANGGRPTRGQIEAHRRLGQKCATWFLRWANALAKEEK